MRNFPQDTRNSKLNFPARWHLNIIVIQRKILLVRNSITCTVFWTHIPSYLLVFLFSYLYSLIHLLLVLNFSLFYITCSVAWSWNDASGFKEVNQFYVLKEKRCPEYEMFVPNRDQVGNVGYHVTMNFVVRSPGRGYWEFFVFTTASRPVLGPTQPPIQRVPGALFLGVKRLGREAELYLHSHNMPSQRGAHLKQSYNFTFTFYIPLHMFIVSSVKSTR
jgi:hypothetical protein